MAPQDYEKRSVWQASCILIVAHYKTMLRLCSHFMLSWTLWFFWHGWTLAALYWLLSLGMKNIARIMILYNYLIFLAIITQKSNWIEFCFNEKKCVQCYQASWQHLCCTLSEMHFIRVKNPNQIVLVLFLTFPEIS